MTSPLSPPEVFQRFLDRIAQQRWEELPALYAENAIVEHPFGPPAHRRLVGRAALQAHFADLRGMGLQMRATDIVVHQTLDPEVIVAEFTYLGIVTTTGQPIAWRNVFVMWIRDGLIAESRDYQGDG